MLFLFTWPPNYDYPTEKIRGYLLGFCDLTGREREKGGKEEGEKGGWRKGRKGGGGSPFFPFLLLPFPPSVLLPKSYEIYSDASLFSMLFSKILVAGQG